MDDVVSQRPFVRSSVVVVVLERTRLVRPVRLDRASGTDYDDDDDDDDGSNGSDVDASSSPSSSLPSSSPCFSHSVVGSDVRDASSSSSSVGAAVGGGRDGVDIIIIIDGRATTRTTTRRGRTDWSARARNGDWRCDDRAGRVGVARDDGVRDWVRVGVQSGFDETEARRREGGFGAGGELRVVAAHVRPDVRAVWVFALQVLDPGDAEFDDARVARGRVGDGEGAVYTDAVVDIHASRRSGDGDLGVGALALRQRLRRSTRGAENQRTVRARRPGASGRAHPRARRRRRSARFARVRAHVLRLRRVVPPSRRRRR